MALVRVEVEPGERPLPTRAAAFVAAADACIDEFNRGHARHPVAAFVPSDFAMVWRMLEAIAAAKLASGNAFCEWGCGVAAVAGLAKLAGFDACGIEINRDLVLAARKLARDFALDVELVQGNFVPEDAGELADCGNEFSWLSEGGPDGHASLGRGPDHFDLVFAYPWPAEENVIFRLFDAYASSDALLLTFHGREGLQLRRKITRREPRGR